MTRKSKNLASKLNKRIEIQKLTETPDTGGGFTSSWSTFKTIWAQVKPRRGRERFDESQIQQEQDFVFTIRYISGITTKMRINFNDRTFNIRGIVNPDEKGEMLELHAEEFR